ncbi:MAG: glycoside hydrolase family 43 protein [Bacteroidales bacterium]|jgi:GH43 family beta-xylosidase|nr:glycoside hydrolase family 43 protein [Bacteroidales bacterium]
MKKHLVFTYLFALLFVPLMNAQQSVSVKKLADIYIRDPYILPEAKSGYYYMYKSTYKSAWSNERGGVEVWKSKDLAQWEGPVEVFRVPEDNWITGTVWAPEVHAYNGKYYLFATLNSDLVWKRREGSTFTFRGTQIFYADKPEGPFLPFDRVPHTPMDYMALDGTLWVDNGVPYMVFCHEWLQVADGTMEVVELKPDLSAPVGQPLRLFCASAAEWTPAGRKDYVTDGCFLYRTKTGKLLMTWSSFTTEGYAIGIAESTTGRVYGPWKQHQTPLFNKDGGHGMIFRTFDGRLCIIFHQPNGPDGAERAYIYELEDTGETLLVKKQR